MNRLLSATKYPLLFILVISLFEGCAHKKEQGPERPRDEVRLERGLQLMEERNYEAAAVIFQSVKDRYPYSKSAIIASLKLGDVLYYKSAYDAAYDQYDEYERLYPNDKNTPYVAYQKGMCHFERMKSFDRDQHHTMEAKEEFDRFIGRYPKSEYYNKAKKNLRKCLISLTQHELYIGHFYFKSGKYKAALERYTDLIKNYPDMGQYYELLEYIRICKQKLALEDKKKGTTE